MDSPTVSNRADSPLETLSPGQRGMSESPWQLLSGKMSNWDGGNAR